METSSSLPVLTPAEAETLVTLLDKVRFPTNVEVFFAWIRNFYANSAELAVLDEQNRILLVQRPPTDPHFPNLWHVPGVIVWPKETLAHAAERCFRKEVWGYGSLLATFPTNFVKHWDNTDATRGHINQFLFEVLLSAREAAQVTKGGFYPLDALPAPMVRSHTRMLGWLKENI